MELSPAQQTVINLMNRDWTLRRPLYHGGVKITSPKKFSTKVVLYATVAKLLKLKLISFRVVHGNYSESYVTYFLTEKAVK